MAKFLVAALLVVAIAAVTAQSSLAGWYKYGDCKCMNNERYGLQTWRRQCFTSTTVLCNTPTYTKETRCECPGLTAGEIAGIVVGAVVGLILIIIIIIWCFYCGCECDDRRMRRWGSSDSDIYRHRAMAPPVVVAQAPQMMPQRPMVVAPPPMVQVIKPASFAPSVVQGPVYTHSSQIQPQLTYVH